MATATCAELIRRCEEAGERTYWNCTTSNVASAGLACRLGHRTERLFEWAGWSRLEDGPVEGEVPAACVRGPA